MEDLVALWKHGRGPRWFIWCLAYDGMFESAGSSLTRYARK